VLTLKKLAWTLVESFGRSYLLEIDLTLSSGKKLGVQKDACGLRGERRHKKSWDGPFKQAEESLTIG